MKILNFLVSLLLCINITNAQTNTFPASGSVGIGTTSPKAILDVAVPYINNDRLGTVFGRLEEGDETGSGTFLGVQGTGTNVIGGKSFSLIHSFYGQINNAINFHRGESVTGGFISFNTNNNTERMRLDENGHLLLGTTSVDNNEGWDKAFQVNGAGHAKMLVTTGVVRSGLWSHESGYYGAVAGGIVGTHSNHPFSIITNGASKVTVLANGYTGIGTATPTERLAVNGNIRAKEIKVEATNWPDYVFRQDYELKPLAELDAYIKEHGHLPDMPKAAEAEKEGVSLGEMNKLLLKKVEELTLYILQMQKNNEAQQAQINQLLLQKK
ncbi:hypothetical protein ACR79S_15065 [Sphingobacterium spiritivorum]|uniref:hypothetical protein n=1 Tax=Sphingobacterium spiritivorum TaxID=258 RepID=UPI003DA32644